MARARSTTPHHTLRSPQHELELIKRPLVTSVKLHPCLEASPDGRPLTEKQRCSGSYRRAVSFQVFKDDSISQRPSLRRLRSRSTVHARRNLPVKEFCYLRTVNLTAAMCREEGGRLTGRSQLDRLESSVGMNFFGWNVVHGVSLRMH